MSALERNPVPERVSRTMRRRQVKGEIARRIAVSSGRGHDFGGTHLEAPFMVMKKSLHQKTSSIPEAQSIARELRTIVLYLQRVQSAIVVAVSALRHQACENDSEVASVLQGSVSDPLQDQIDRLESIANAELRDKGDSPSRATTRIRRPSKPHGIRPPRPVRHD